MCKKSKSDFFYLSIKMYGFTAAISFIFRDKSLDSQAVVVSIFGKSSFLSHSCKGEIFDKIMGYSIFKKSMLEDPDINFDILVSEIIYIFCGDICTSRLYNYLYLQCNIEGFYDKRDNIIYLHLLGTFDAHSLLKIYDQFAVQLEDKVQFFSRIIVQYEWSCHRL